MFSKNFLIKKIVTFVIVSTFLILPCTLPSHALGATPDGSDYVYIRNAKNGQYITVKDTLESDGAELQTLKGDQSISQLWKLVEERKTIYTIRYSFNERYMISVQGGSSANGAKIVLKYVAPNSPIPESAKFFLLSFDPIGACQIISDMGSSSGNVKALQPLNSGTDGAKIIQQDSPDNIDDGAAQLWIFESENRSIQVKGTDLVDIGKHCDWDANTKYISLLNNATTAWNNYIGGTLLRADKWYYVQDVKIYDVAVDPNSNNTYATTFYNSKKIEFYIDTMDSVGSDHIRQKVVMHELGHALGLAHNNNVMGDIMHQGPLAYGTSLSFDDLESYKKAAENY